VGPDPLPPAEAHDAHVRDVDAQRAAYDEARPAIERLGGATREQLARWLAAETDGTPRPRMPRGEMTSRLAAICQRQALEAIYDPAAQGPRTKGGRP
jgi:hypothetical protein